MNNRTWATIRVMKLKGGRSVVLHDSQRGLFQAGDMYYNHNLKHYPYHTVLDVVVRYSPKGRRMVQAIHQKEIR